MKEQEQKLIDSISSETVPDENFYKSIYGLEISPDVSPDFKHGIASRLIIYDLADDYNAWVDQYEKERDGVMQQAAKQMRRDMDRQRPAILTAKTDIPRAGDLPEIVRPFNPISMHDLQLMDIPPIEYLISGIMPKGLGILSAPPKYYKSFLALQMCLAICTHGKALNRETIRHACLYLDLESGNRRPRDRVRGMIEHMPDISGETLDNLYIVTLQTDDIRTIGNGFIESLTETIRQYDDIGLIVIDVFQRIRTHSKRGQTSYEYDYEDLTALKKCCEQNDVSILLVHHNNKGNDRGDVFNNMSGSTGMLGAVDYCWMISKDKRQDDDAILHITGRDIETVDISIRFNKDILQWEYVGTREEVETQRHFEEYEQSNIIATIRKLVADNGGEWSGSARDIIKASRYLGCEIHETEQQTGQQINEFSDLLLVIDKIEYSYKRSSREREYIFIRH